MNTALLHGLANYDPLGIYLAKLPEKERKEYFARMRNRLKVVENIKRFEERENGRKCKGNSN
jgi:hypothetical protein